MVRDRYRIACDLMRRADIDRTLAAAGRPLTVTDNEHHYGLQADWQVAQQYHRLQEGLR